MDDRVFDSVEEMFDSIIKEDEREKRHHPVRWWWRVGRFQLWNRYIHNPWYWLKCRVWHRHNVLVLRDLPPTWTDRDHRLLHANFQILKDFVEQEKPFEWFDTEESHRKADWVELRRLCAWWEIRRFLKDEDDEQYAYDNAMLTRLMAVRHLLWT
jgi:hypothetical protein